MALLDDIKELIFKVENEKPEEDKPEDKKDDKDEKVENEKVDKRKLIDEVGGILKGKVDDEIIRTVIGKIEKAAYDESEAGTADNKKVKNEDTEEDEKETKEIKEDVKEDVENKKCNNSKPDFYGNLMKIYNSSVSVKEPTAEYVSRVEREKAADDYFKA